MFQRLVIFGLAIVVAAHACASVTAAEPARKAKVLMLTESRGFMHGSVKRDKNDSLSPAEIAMTQLGQQTGLFDVHCTQNCEADFTRDNLKNYDIVMFYTTGELPISDETRDYLLGDWLTRKGHGFIGFHSATDTFRTEKPEHRWYQELIGGTFTGHPWNSNNTVTITVHDTHHPAMQPFDAEFKFKDEIYEYTNWKPENVRVLMSLNMEKCDPKRPYHVPVAWAKNVGAGRLFYTNLGHNNETWTNPLFLKSTENAVRWILYLDDGDATPNPEVSQAQHENSRAAAENAAK